MRLEVIVCRLWDQPAAAKDWSNSITKLALPTGCAAGAKNHTLPHLSLPLPLIDNALELIDAGWMGNVPLLINLQWLPNIPVGEFQGGSSYVERGFWNNQIIAVKFLKGCQTISGMAQSKKLLHRELAAWSKLAHPNILPLLGVVCIENTVGMASPYMPHGSASMYIRQHPEADVFQILYDVTGGIKYLASQSPPIAHGDLKGANVLINPEGKACICDFGLSRSIEGRVSVVTSGSGTFRWMAPEQLSAENMIVSLPADIFAWGMLALEAIDDWFSAMV
ncbi:unnamed protein product [Rhizoctonia solani]|uniref:Protein kinase domain-containing protein n=1 Tax=Rhizoctonia solani TaxID=456999 RepID=A0A8H3H1Q9_9AGAM|nr:unnamed protein product [Rhizoctonia solani]